MGMWGRILHTRNTYLHFQGARAFAVPLFLTALTPILLDFLTTE